MEVGALTRAAVLHLQRVLGEPCQQLVQKPRRTAAFPREIVVEVSTELPPSRACGGETILQLRLSAIWAPSSPSSSRRVALRRNHGSHHRRPLSGCLPQIGRPERSVLPARSVRLPEGRSRTSGARFARSDCSPKSRSERNPVQRSLRDGRPVPFRATSSIERAAWHALLLRNQEFPARCRVIDVHWSGDRIHSDR